MKTISLPFLRPARKPERKLPFYEQDVTIELAVSARNHLRRRLQEMGEILDDCKRHEAMLALLDFVRACHQRRRGGHGEWRLPAKLCDYAHETANAYQASQQDLRWCLFGIQWCVEVLGDEASDRVLCELKRDG